MGTSKSLMKREVITLVCFLNTDMYLCTHIYMQARTQRQHMLHHTKIVVFILLQADYDAVAALQ